MTVISQDAEKLPHVAVIVALPAEIAVTTPFFTVATSSFDELHVMVLSVAASGVTVALSVSDSPTPIVSSLLSRVIPVTGTFGLPTLSGITSLILSP